MSSDYKYRFIRNSYIRPIVCRTSSEHSIRYILTSIKMSTNQLRQDKWPNPVCQLLILILVKIRSLISSILHTWSSAAGQRPWQSLFVLMDTLACVWTQSCWLKDSFLVCSSTLASRSSVSQVSNGCQWSDPAEVTSCWNTVLHKLWNTACVVEGGEVVHQEQSQVGIEQKNQ